MPSLITLGTTVKITTRFIYNAPLLYTNDGDLAFSIGDWVRQFMLAPPFSWRWNRGFVAPIMCLVGKSDYTINIPDFGYLEKATIVYPPVPGNNPQLSKELEMYNSLVAETVLGQPSFISAINDDGNKNITFRLMPIPDVVYALNIIYQKASPVFHSLADTWAPIPDYYSYIYNQGFLAKAYEYKSDERFAFAHSEFMRNVVAANDGLTDTQKNIFLSPRIVYQREIQGGLQTGQIAKQGRST